MPQKVLIIAYFWPPDNAAGTHRPLRFVRHLRQFGWEPVILTADPIDYVRFDPDLLHKVPEGVRVVRAPHRDPWLSFQIWRSKKSSTPERQDIISPGSNSDGNRPASLRQLAQKMVHWLEPRIYHPDQYMGWIRPAIAKAQKNFKGPEFQAILATGGPWSDFEVGYQLSKRWQVPLLLDFRDPWTITSNGSFDNERPGWAKALDRRRLGKYLAHAGAVIFLHDIYAECYLSAYRNFLVAEKIHLIPHGIDSENIPEIKAEVTMPPQGEHLEILYAGLLSSRNYAPLFQGLARLVRTRGANLKIRLTFIGEQDPKAISDSEKLGLANMVTFLPTMPYDFVNQSMKNAHALLLLGEHPQRGYELYLASKVFHYLAMRRPILGVLPANAGRRLLARLGSGLLADVDSVEEIEAALLALYAAWETDTLHQFLPQAESLLDYVEPRLTEALVHALEGMAPRCPYREGEAMLPASLKRLA